MSTTDHPFETRPIGGVYRIPENNIAPLEAAVAKLNKRATKLGVAPILFELGEREIEQERDFRTDKLLTKVFFQVTITGQEPKFAGWSFVGTLQHVEEINGVILRAAPGREEQLTAYRNATNSCEHCGHRRKRKDTFVVEHEDGRRLQVGRQCLRDFLGHQNPQALAAAAEFISLVGQMGSDAEDEGWGGGASQDKPGLINFLLFVAACIRELGWTSRATAREKVGAVATANVAMDAMGKWSKNAHDRHKWPSPTESDTKRVEEAIAWAENELEPSGDYEHNLKLICGSGMPYVDYRCTGIAASLFVAHDRHLGRLAVRAKAASLAEKSKHFGESGERGDFLMTVLGMHYFDSDFGTRTLVRMIGDDDNIATWWASRIPRDEKGWEVVVGEKYLVRGTVKEHGEYKGTKQTVLSRCVFWDPSTPPRKPKKKRAKRSAGAKPDQPERHRSPWKPA